MAPDLIAHSPDAPNSLGLDLEFTLVALSSGNKEEIRISKLSVLGYAVISHFYHGRCMYGVPAGRKYFFELWYFCIFAVIKITTQTVNFLN